MSTHEKLDGPASPPAFRHAEGPGAWQNVPVLTYKEEGDAPFKAVTRQVLFHDEKLKSEFRYFEVGSGGHSTLERHEHVHAVMIHRGRGQCLVGTEVREIAVGDLVFIPSLTWHQFRANRGEPLGFLCLVNAERDKPQLPDADAKNELSKTPAVTKFLAT